MPVASRQTPRNHTYPFYFHDLSASQMVEEINTEFPIKLGKLAHLVDRVHQKYPLIGKTEIAIIIRHFFETFRETLILGKIIHLNNLIHDAKFIFGTFSRDGRVYPKLMLQFRTPVKLARKPKCKWNLRQEERLKREKEQRRALNDLELG